MATEHERQEDIIAGIGGVADILEVHTQMLETIATSQAELRAWLETPPSSDLPDLLRSLTEAIGHQAGMIEALRLMLADLPERVAKAVNDGEIDGPG